MISFSVPAGFAHFISSISAMCLLQVTFVYGGDDPLQSSKYHLDKRTTVRKADQWSRSISHVEWEPKKVAVIVCDVWDYHHCMNAVRRLDQMLPAMDALLRKMRVHGSIVIHAPSDCMPHYEGRPARRRAAAIPKPQLPSEIASWNCKLESELATTYPIDQSDGGEDDEPIEHQAWSEKLQSLGRNPNLPWNAQNPAITIDEAKDYISDRGDEVWAILKHHKIEHVLMIGVHTNMCVLGRPFGLRQLVKNGIDVVLVRDLTDCMYNPNRWPYVDHYSGNDLIISYVEQAVCPTITSDQILGGRPVEFGEDRRPKKDLLPNQITISPTRTPQWKLIDWKTIAAQWLDSSAPSKSRDDRSRPTVMLRCSLRIQPTAFDNAVYLHHPSIKNAWLNGHALKQSIPAEKPSGFPLQLEDTFGNDDANVLVIELNVAENSPVTFEREITESPILIVGDHILSLGENWQWNPQPTTPSDTNLPLPAKFALPPAVFYSFDVR